MRTTHRGAGFPVLLKGFRLALAVEGLRPKTVNNYLRDAESLAKHFVGRSPRSISTSDIRAHIATLQDGRAPKTVREAQLALRRFFRFLVREGELVSMGLRDWEKRIVRVDGKAGVRDVPLGTATLQAVERYVRRLGIAEGPL